MINLRHPLVQWSQKIDWQSSESRFGGLYATGVGRPGHPIRMMVALQLLKHTCNVSDEEVIATWVENTYWQHFSGEQYFRHDLPIDPSLMTGFRKRIGEAGCEFILGLTLSAGLATKTVAKSSLAVVNVDTTVQDKAVTFPTDARLLHIARIALVRLGPTPRYRPAPELRAHWQGRVRAQPALRTCPPDQPSQCTDQKAAYLPGPDHPGH